MTTFKSVTVYCGGADYAVTSENVEKMTEKLKAFNEKKEWSYTLWNFLGIAKDDKKGTTVTIKRFEDLKEITKDATEPALKKLAAELAKVKMVPIAELVRKVRRDPTERLATQATMYDKLIKAGVDKEQAKLMSKAL